MPQPHRRSSLIVGQVKVAVTRKQMKNLRLRVSPAGQVLVSAPFSTRDAAIRTFVESTDADAGRQIRSFKAIADGFLGFRVEEDFLASLGRRFLVFEEPTATGLIPGLCLVLQPNDGEKVQNCVRRLTTSLGAFAGIKGVGVSVQERGGVSFIETSGAPVPIAPAWATRGERLFLALPGAIRASVFPASAEAEFIWETKSDSLLKLAEELPRYGYVLEDPANESKPRPAHQEVPVRGVSIR